MKNRPQCKDIPDEVVLQACDQFHAEIRKPGYQAEMPLTPEQLLADRWPPKLILAKMEGMHRRGLIDYGVSLRTAWRTSQQ